MPLIMKLSVPERKEWNLSHTWNRNKYDIAIKDIISMIGQSLPAVNLIIPESSCRGMQKVVRGLFCMGRKSQNMAGSY